MSANPGAGGVSAHASGEAARSAVSAERSQGVALMSPAARSGLGTPATGVPGIVRASPRTKSDAAFRNALLVKLRVGQDAASAPFGLAAPASSALRGGVRPRSASHQPSLREACHSMVDELGAEFELLAPNDEELRPRTRSMAEPVGPAEPAASVSVAEGTSTAPPDGAGASDGSAGTSSSPPTSATEATLAATTSASVPVGQLASPAIGTRRLVGRTGSDIRNSLLRRMETMQRQQQHQQQQQQQHQGSTTPLHGSPDLSAAAGAAHRPVNVLARIRAATADAALSSQSLLHVEEPSSAVPNSSTVPTLALSSSERQSEELTAAPGLSRARSLRGRRVTGSSLAAISGLAPAVSTSTGVLQSDKLRGSLATSTTTAANEDDDDHDDGDDDDAASTSSSDDDDQADKAARIKSSTSATAAAAAAAANRADGEGAAVESSAGLGLGSPILRAVTAGPGREASPQRLTSNAVVPRQSASEASLRSAPPEWLLLLLRMVRERELVVGSRHKYREYAPSRQLSKQDHHWVPSSSVRDCQHCGARFGFLLRKHHCRLCGACVCASCSPYTGQSVARWCRRCNALLRGAVLWQPPSATAPDPRQPRAPGEQPVLPPAVAAASAHPGVVAASLVLIMAGRTLASVTTATAAITSAAAARTRALRSSAAPRETDSPLTSFLSWMPSLGLVSGSSSAGSSSPVGSTNLAPGLPSPLLISSPSMPSAAPLAPLPSPMLMPSSPMRAAALLPVSSPRHSSPLSGAAKTGSYLPLDRVLNLTLRREALNWTVAGSDTLSFLDAALHGDWEEVQTRMRAGQPVTARALSSGTTVLHAAATGNHRRIVTALLTEQGFPIDMRDYQGRTPLHAAAVAGAAEAVEALVAGGADETAHDDEGMTPLDLATLLGRRNVIALLDPASRRVTEQMVDATTAGSRAAVAWWESVRRVATDMGASSAAAARSAAEVAVAEAKARVADRRRLRQQARQLATGPVLSALPSLSALQSMGSMAGDARVSGVHDGQSTASVSDDRSSVSVSGESADGLDDDEMADNDDSASGLSEASEGVSPAGSGGRTASRRTHSSPASGPRSSSSAAAAAAAAEAGASRGSSLQMPSRDDLLESGLTALDPAAQALQANLMALANAEARRVQARQWAVDLVLTGARDPASPRETDPDRMRRCFEQLDLVTPARRQARESQADVRRLVGTVWGLGHCFGPDTDISAVIAEVVEDLRARPLPANRPAPLPRTVMTHDLPTVATTTATPTPTTMTMTSSTSEPPPIVLPTAATASTPPPSEVVVVVAVAEPSTAHASEPNEAIVHARPDTSAMERKSSSTSSVEEVEEHEVGVVGDGEDRRQRVTGGAHAVGSSSGSAGKAREAECKAWSTPLSSSAPESVGRDLLLAGWGSESAGAPRKRTHRHVRHHRSSQATSGDAPTATTVSQRVLMVLGRRADPSRGAGAAGSSSAGSAETAASSSLSSVRGRVHSAAASLGDW